MLPVSRESQAAYYSSGGLVYPETAIEIKRLSAEEEHAVGASGISTYTALFRTENILARALAETYDRTGKGEDLVIASTACSVGAEVDSIVATHNKNRNGGRLAITGFDINPEAIRRAQSAKYWVGAGSIEHEKAARNNLQGYGFVVDPNPPKRDTFSASSALVRKGHNVGFEQHDMTKEAKLTGSADLVLANNVLYHLDTFRAYKFLMNAARMLRENGVLSIGDSGSFIGTVMSGELEYYDQRFGEWLHEASMALRHDFDLKPIAFGRKNQPTMFARTV